MCTVSWIHELDGYQILCNRDEKLTRLPAKGPTVAERHGVRFIAPRDQDYGGAWMSVNDLGVAVCLLNGAGPAPAAARSRGTIVLAAADSATALEAVDRIAKFGLRCFAPFTLLAVDLRGRSSLCVWSGAIAEVIEDAGALMPLTSSSFDPDEVCDRRRKCLLRKRASRGLVTPDLLFDFHCSHENSPSAYSTCMHRDDAATVSFSWVTVRTSEVTYLYSPAAPCQWAAAEVVKLVIAK